MKYFGWKVMVLLVFLFGGCTTTHMIHIGDVDKIANLDDKLSKAPLSVIYQSHKHKKVSLSIIEFNEQGNFFEEKGKDNFKKILKFVEQRGRNQEIYIFTHGWKHNAQSNDTNLKDFKNFLLKKGKNSNKMITGIYLGWRGSSFNAGIFENFTFWDRKNTSEDVGEGAITEVLIEIEKIQKRTHSSLVTIAHSLGSSVLITALKPLLTERFMAYKDDDSKPLRGYGNIVVLYNSAIEALKLKNLMLMVKDYEKKRGNKKAFANQSYPIFVSISGKNDWATNYVFPFGRFFATVFETYETYNERVLDRTTIGNNDEIQTHEIYLGRGSSIDKLAINKKPSFTKYHNNKIYFKDINLTIERVQKGFHNRNPYWFMHDNQGKIIIEHNKINNKELTILLDKILYKK